MSRLIGLVLSLMSLGCATNDRNTAGQSERVGAEDERVRRDSVLRAASTWIEVELPRLAHHRSQMDFVGFRSVLYADRVDSARVRDCTIVLFKTEESLIERRLRINARLGGVDLLGINLDQVRSTESLVYEESLWRLRVRMRSSDSTTVQEPPDEPYYRGTFFVIPVQDVQSGNRIAKALTDAARACGADPSTY